MNLRNSMAVFIPAVMLALLATLIELSSRLPPALAYFTIALLAASLTLLFTGKGKARSAAAAGSHSRKETGSVKWFSASKGFGFITRDNVQDGKGQDIFVHFRSISGNGHRVLREGQRVEFEVTEGSKGLQAEDVITLK